MAEQDVVVPAVAVETNPPCVPYRFATVPSLFFSRKQNRVPVLETTHSRTHWGIP